jgi:hypothetical protein
MAGKLAGSGQKFKGFAMIQSWRNEMIRIERKRKITRPTFEGMWLSLQDGFCRFQTALWFAPVATC